MFSTHHGQNYSKSIAACTKSSITFFLNRRHLPRTHHVDEATGVDKELWSRLNAAVLQWICGTISNDLLHTIIETDAVAQQAWERLASIFQDNKNARALYLEN